MKQIAFNFFRSIYGQVVLFILAFAFLRWLWMFSFFNGFLGAYEKLSLTNPFHSWSIFFGSFLNPVYVLVLIAGLLPFIIHKKYFPKNVFSYSRMERFFFSVIALVIGWELATYDYNYYLDRAFYFDRILLLLLPFITYRVPQLTILFLSFALVYRAQFNFPVDGFPMFDKRLLFDLLICSIVYQYCRIFIRDFKTPVMFFVLCIVASVYFASGLKKIWISPHGYEWVMNNDPLNLFNNVHLRGWMACASESTLDSFRELLKNFGSVFQWFILLIELGALFLLRYRKFATALLICFFFMHIGIFLFGSMLFWKWMFVDLLLIVILWKYKTGFGEMFSDRRLSWLSVGIIGVSFLWLRPISIGWHDTNVNQFYTYEVVGEDGKIYALDKNEMNPYHQWFQYDQFFFLTPSPTLPVSGFGYTYDYDLAALIQDADSSTFDGLVAPVNFNKGKKKQYDEFIAEYFRNRNRLPDKKFLLDKISPPHHLYSNVCVNPYDDQSPVRTFRVIYNLTYTENNNSHWLMRDVIDEISIPPQE